MRARSSLCFCRVALGIGIATTRAPDRRVPPAVRSEQQRVLRQVPLRVGPSACWGAEGLAGLLPDDVVGRALGRRWAPCGGPLSCAGVPFHRMDPALVMFGAMIAVFVVCTILLGWSPGHGR